MNQKFRVGDKILLDEHPHAIDNRWPQEGEVIAVEPRQRLLVRMRNGSMVILETPHPHIKPAKEVA